MPNNGLARSNAHTWMVSCWEGNREVSLIGDTIWVNDIGCVIRQRHTDVEGAYYGYGGPST